MTSPIDNAPVVIVGGFLTKNSTSYWGDLQQHFPGRKVIIAPVGACSSLHDRACEIYYSLKGGRVDYGAEHAREHKHGQYGRKYSKGFYPEWSASKPVHFATHSLGGPTVTKLIALLRSGFFGQDAHPDMVRSLFAVAAPFKGTPTVYLLGASYTGSHLLRPFSLGNFLAKYIHISSFLSPLFSYDPEAWDFQPDSRNLGVFSLPHRCEEVEQEAEQEEEESKPSWTWTGLVRSVRTLWTQLRTSDWADSADSGSYDATFHASDARDRAGESELNANTFYCSLMGTITTKEADSNHHRPDRSFRSDVFLYILAKMVGSFSYNVQPAPAFLFDAATATPPTSSTSNSKPECSHPIARARGLSVHTANLFNLPSSSSKPSSPASDSSALASASSSGSSGWNSPAISPTTFSFSFPARPLSQFSDVEEEEEIEPVPVVAPVAPITRPKLSIKPLSITPPSGPVSSPTPTARRPGHSREVSLTDCYADWAAEWSTRQYPVPGGWETRDVATATPTPVTAIPPRTPFSSSTPEVAPAPAAAPKLRDDLWENDGVVAVYSQTHPADCSDVHCKHHGDLDLDEKAGQIGSLTDGTWHVFKSRGMSHNCLVGGLARYESHRNAVWTKISQAMVELDSARAACSVC
ncbi:hypothetical protein M408DRAFT_19373 [Serendipita vermifera MAFF 305830]|uniref:Lipase-like C-terminal domain-containing protein n=1 Tax=Serendipita vermifera MAFF 305830 TaxID=933852 RepID=A0A0C3BSV6_SERVB|nr:hypothetical protein M408DRAFT_19373 [Serendipita vermifera MAFF 305830]